MYWNRPNLPNRPILSISNLSPRNYDAGLRFMFLHKGERLSNDYILWSYMTKGSVLSIDF